MSQELMPCPVDTTVAERIANEQLGPRYGVDWIYHDDRLGYLPAKPVRTLAELTGPTAQVVAVDDALKGFHFRRFVELGRDEITITCPNGNIVTVENKGRLENRVLYALAQAALEGR